MEALYPPQFIFDFFYDTEEDEGDFLQKRIIEKGKRLMETAEEYRIVGMRFDDKTLYTTYEHKGQEFFEKESSKTIHALSELIREKAYHIIDLLSFCAEIRWRISPESGYWRTGDSQASLSTPMRNKERKVVREKFCNNMKEYVKGEYYYDENYSAIFFLSDFNSKIKFSDYSELRDKISPFLPSTSNYTDEDLVREFSRDLRSDGSKKLSFLVCDDMFSDYEEEDEPGIDYFCMLEYLYQRSSENDISDYKRLNYIAKLHYYLCLKSPFVRGGGSIAEWICGALMIAFEIPFLGWNVEVWNRAVTRGVSQFIYEYPSYVKPSSESFMTSF